MGSERNTGLPGTGSKPWKTLFIAVVLVVAVIATISIIRSAGELGQDEFVKSPAQDAKEPKEKASEEPDRDAMLLEADGKTKPNVVRIDPQDGPKLPRREKKKPTTSYPDMPAASKTARRASTLDLRNPAALKIAKSLWKRDEKIIHLVLISKMEEADNRACVQWLREIVDAEGPSERVDDIRAQAVAALGKMKHAHARKYFLSLDGHPDEHVRIFYATTLGYLKDRKSKEELQYLLKADISKRVRKQAETSITKRKQETKDK
jgi:HEAT repeat protein